MDEYIAKGPVLFFISGAHKERFGTAILNAGWPNDHRFCSFLFLSTMTDIVWSSVGPTVDFEKRCASLSFELDPETYTAYELETIRLAFDLLDGQGYCRINALVSAAESPVWFEAIVSGLRLASSTFDLKALRFSLENFD